MSWSLWGLVALGWASEPAELIEAPAEPVEAPAAEAPVAEGGAAADEGPALTADEGPALTAEEEAFLEVLVVGEQIVSARRDAVVRSLEELGWKARRRSDGVVVFRGTEGWMGKAHLQPTGDLEFTQPVLAFQGARQTGGSYDAQRASDNDQQAGTAGISVSPLPDKRIVRAVQTSIREQVQDDVRAYQQAIQGRHLAISMQKIPDRLDRLWQLGEAPDGSQIEAMPARKAWVLDYWATRTSTPEGHAVCGVIEAWIRETVQLSEHAISEPERLAAEAQRGDGRQLRLD